MTLELGGDVPTTSYSYFRWSGDDGVYMCDSGLTDALLTTATRLLPVEQPTLSKDLIDQVTLSRADGETAVLLSNDGDGHYTGLLVEPYQYPVDPEQAEALLTALSSFRLGTREAEANAETRAQYGLDDPELTLWLHQAAGTVGQVDENGQLAAVEVREQALRFVIGRARESFLYLRIRRQLLSGQPLSAGDAAGRHPRYAGGASARGPGRRRPQRYPH